MAQEMNEVLLPHELLSSVIQRWVPAAAIKQVQPMTPDASLRRYYRLELKGAPYASVVAMVFQSTACPEYDVGKAVRSDDAYVDLTDFLSAHQVAVPQLLFDSRDCAVLIIEDLGDRTLIEDLLGPNTAEDAVIDDHYRQAIDQLVKIQRISRSPGMFAFERSFRPETYYREMMEFRDFVLLDPEAAVRPLSGAEEAAVDNAFRSLAAELDGFEKVLCHRDFHSWNLMVDAKNRVRVIDFQDALLSTRCYDLVGLLNDRDTDTALGRPRYEALLDYFQEKIGRPEWFFAEYRRVLLQRDLKVAGRFRKLSSKRGLRNYDRWVPGTLRRLGRTLAELCLESQTEASRRYGDFFQLVLDRVPEAAAGAEPMLSKDGTVYLGNG